MGPNPYRVLERDASEGSPEVPSRPWDIALVIIALWLASVAHLVIACSTNCGAAFRRVTGRAL